MAAFFIFTLAVVMQKDIYNFLCRFLSPAKIELFDRVAKERTRHITLVAEDIYQTQNTSAMLRSADCYGVQDVHIIENEHSFQLNSRIAKGAGQWLTLHRYTDAANNTAKCIDRLRSMDYRIVATSPHAGAVPVEKLSIKNKTAIIIGTELTGVSSVALDSADESVSIPTYGFTESLNASVASAILLCRLRETLLSSGINWQLGDDEKLELKIEWAKRSVQSSQGLLEMFESGELK